MHCITEETVVKKIQIFEHNKKKQLLLSWLRMMNSYLHVPVCSRDKSAMLTVPRLLQAVFGFSFYWSHSVILIISSWQTLQTTCRKLQHTSHTCGEINEETKKLSKRHFFGEDVHLDRKLPPTMLLCIACVHSWVWLWSVHLLGRRERCSLESKAPKLNNSVIFIYLSSKMNSILNLSIWRSWVFFNVCQPSLKSASMNMGSAPVTRDMASRSR